MPEGVNRSEDIVHAPLSREGIWRVGACTHHADLAGAEPKIASKIGRSQRFPNAIGYISPIKSQVSSRMEIESIRPMKTFWESKFIKNSFASPEPIHDEDESVVFERPDTTSSDFSRYHADATVVVID